MTKTTAYVTHSDCSRHDPGWGHPEHQGRLPAVARAVYRDMLTLFEPLLEVEGRPAAPEDLLLAHAPGYVERVRAAVEAAREAGSPVPFEGGTVVSGASWEAALAAVGCGLTAVDAVLAGEVRNAFCAVRPPGNEVAAESAGGFGIFNTVAVAARHLRERRGMARVLVVDASASGGRGTARIVASDAGIRFLPLAAAGADDPGAALEAAADGFPPDFLLLSLGLDVPAREPIDYYDLSRALRERADALCGGRLVSVMEGGFDPSASGKAVVQHLRALAGLPAA